MMIVRSLFSKSFVFKMFSLLTLKPEPGVFKLLWSEERFLRFRDGLVWQEGLTGKIPPV